MAEIWFVREGTSPTKGYEAADRAAGWCIQKLRLKPSDWIASDSERLIVTNKSDLTGSKDNQYVIVEVDDKDIDGLPGNGWRKGYYLLSILADDARKMLKESP